MCIRDSNGPLLNEASALAVNCHTSLCFHSHPKRKGKRGYAEKATSTPDIGNVWYLPHHSVNNANKPDKVRVVFDCSAKCNGTSLNENVFQGTDMTNKLICVLLRFREEPVAFTADIEAMFQQVNVSVDDRDFLIS